MAVLLGESLLSEIVGRTVVDFGCGEGHEAVDLASRGAAKVIGVDIRESALQTARDVATRAGVENTCVFTTRCAEVADRIISLDSFEHFENPALILEEMANLLKPDGKVLISFGPTWYHPSGGHLFSVFPWAHLLFSERALIKWRNDIRSDGATRFGEVEGGLNQMTIGRFEELVAASSLQIEFLETVPIRKLRFVHSRLLREFTTSIIRCRLTKGR